jgi:hypothetical protein
MPVRDGRMRAPGNCGAGAARSRLRGGQFQETRISQRVSASQSRSASMPIRA